MSSIRMISRWRDVMRRAAILGSGFGLYGYLPAMIESGVDCVVLPERYKEKFSTRMELAHLASVIEWVTDEREALARVDCVAMALRPDLQAQWILFCLEQPGIERILLEKPLAPAPDHACSLFQNLMDSGKIFRIGYLFRSTVWGRKLLQSFQDPPPEIRSGKIYISWSFLAHHYRTLIPTWKRDQSLGGGALRFYGIHLIALLAELGYKNVSCSRTSGSASGDIAQWSASFSGTGLPDCEIRVDSHATHAQFTIEHEVNHTTTTLVNLTEPFEVEVLPLLPNKRDQRIPLLSMLCQSLWKESSSTYATYRDTLDLWGTVESWNTFNVTGTM